jgi:hypothetical protein
MATNFEVLQTFPSEAELQFQYSRESEAFFAVEPGAGDGAPPVVTLISPASLLLERDTPIVIDVTDNIALRRCMVVARFDTLAIEELVHNGDRFAAAYTGASSRQPITGGLRYTIRRNAGWPAPPVLDVFAIDTSGSEG